MIPHLSWHSDAVKHIGLLLGYSEGLEFFLVVGDIHSPLHQRFQNAQGARNGQIPSTMKRNTLENLLMRKNSHLGVFAMEGAG
ncbi:MAG: hypothetical protein HY399_02325 [Elusimicrobia bacterium]|nr:hypothetical protein [Elusimicrobiota bacterium]